MEFIDYTKASPKARPSAARIVADWKRRGRPQVFAVSWGEFFAKFALDMWGQWHDSGNGCRGVDRSAVVAKLREVR